MGGGGGHGASHARGGDSGIAQLLGANRNFVWPVAPGSFRPSLADLRRFEFDVWQHSEDELLALTVEIFQDMGLCAEFDIPLPILQNFVVSVRKSYRANAFHNWYHGFSVFHFAYLLLRATDGAQPISKLEVLATMVAALCHDLDHPGRTNAYEIATGSALALLHNDRSVLENHHLAFLFTHILSDPRCNIFANCSRPTWQRARALVIGGVMSTDMAVHFDRCKDLEARQPATVLGSGDGVAADAVAGSAASVSGAASIAAAATNAAAPALSRQPSIAKLRSPFDVSIEMDRQYFIDLVVHASDLSGQVFPTSIAAAWEARISAEFEEQVPTSDSPSLTHSLLRICEASSIRPLCVCPVILCFFL